MTVSMVYPSGGAFATMSAPRMLLAPGRLSTTIGWPSEVCIFCVTTRVTVSVMPPPV